MKKNFAHRAFATLALLGLVFGTAAAQAAEPAPYQEGLHYFLIDDAPAAPSEEMELIEAFSYLCTHCNTFDPYINNWIKRKPENVSFRRIPVVFGRSSWELYARGYVTAEMLGIAETAHGDLMHRLWNEKQILRSMDELADFYSQYGADKEKFISTSRSFAVDGKMRKDQLAVQNYGIRGTPALVLNGRYRITGGAAVPNYDVMMDIVDFLIEKESEYLTGSGDADAAAQ